jgi:hypothetical protein
MFGILNRLRVGFAIAIATFWLLRSTEEHRLGQMGSLLSDSWVHNELRRWQSLGMPPYQHAVLHTGKCCLRSASGGAWVMPTRAGAPLFLPGMSQQEMTGGFSIARVRVPSNSPKHITEEMWEGFASDRQTRHRATPGRRDGA